MGVGSALAASTGAARCESFCVRRGVNTVAVQRSPAGWPSTLTPSGQGGVGDTAHLLRGHKNGVRLAGPGQTVGQSHTPLAGKPPPALLVVWLTLRCPLAILFTTPLGTAAATKIEPFRGFGRFVPGGPPLAG